MIMLLYIIIQKKKKAYYDTLEANNKNNEIHDLSKSLFNSYMIKDKQN